jgi:branched-chain amino acid transport system substrate-binding protein
MAHDRGSCLVVAALIGLGAVGCASDVPIGAVISQTGVADVYGAKVKKGLDLAVEEINAGGGIDGRPVRLVYRDDQSRPDVGVRVAEELIDQEHVSAIIGGLTSSVALAIAEVCERKRAVLLSPTASSPKLTDAGLYVFRNYPSDILEGTSMADFARDLGLERVVVFAMDNEFGRGLSEVFQRKFQSRFRQVLKTFNFRERDPASLSPLVQEAVSLNPEGIYLIGYVKEVGELLKQLHAAGSQAVLMGTASTIEELVPLIGEAAEHLVYFQPPFDRESDEPEVRAFVDAYRARHREEPDTFSAHAYDAMKLIAEAIRRAGGLLHPDNVRDALASIDSYKGASGSAGFDLNGDVVQYPRLFIIHHGKPVPYERFIEEGGSLAIQGRS